MTLASTLQGLRARPRRLWWLLLPALAAVSFVVKSASTLPPPINLSTTPLYSAGTRDKPTLSLALSVEFPTVGAQYTPGGNTDATYDAIKEYLGYFDTESCYGYNNDSNANLRRFDRTGPATSHGCGGTGFSGNFMNWATSSAIDVLRLGLTGGDRIVDTSSLTVLQRAVLPTTFWNSSNFPAKRLTAALAGNAVPNNLKGSFVGDIWVANCLNRVHFGTSATGSCDGPGNNSVLGYLSHSKLWSDFSNCAVENNPCTPGSFSKNESKTYEVAYGANLSFNFKIIQLTRGNQNDSPQPSFNCKNSDFSPDPAVGVGKACYIRLSSSSNPRFETTTATKYGGPVLSLDNFFYSRVQVCESNASGILQDPRAASLPDRQRALCIKYPGGKYKPAGQLQKNSDNLRIAAFGYLMDNNNNPERYGGVLRAPMKYVGGNAYDSTGNLINGNNPKLEWELNTGIFIANPEGAIEGKSGVINYLNQFGRTGNIQGTYKTFDPVGELYYETLRYVQGLGPTLQATEGMTDDMKDGFPVYTNWLDPHAGGSNAQNYSCIRNNIVVIGDVNTHNDKSIPGNTTRLNNGEFSRSASLSSNEPDFTFWTQVVGKFESNQQITYKDGKGIDRITNNPNTTINAARNGMENQDINSNDKNSYYIAGMAYWSNTHDIRGTEWSDSVKRRPGMRVSTYILDVNEFGNQNDPDTRRFNNQFFLASKYGGFDDKSEKGNPFLDKNDNLDNSNWQRAGDPGEASNYFLSSNARTVLKSLDNIFEAIAKKGNSIAGSATSSTQLKTDNYVYQGQFDPASWSGDLTSMPINVNATTKAVTLSTSAQWSASNELDKKDPATRKIFVGKTFASAISAATPFTWADIDADLIAALKKATPSATPDTDARGEARLNYLRGDRSLETSTTEATLRRRSSRLGDIINSGVVLSGTPTQTFSTTAYQTFYTSNKSRTKTLFVGANDGMLHAFNAGTGEELFGYIPSWLGSKLSALTNDNYVVNHQSYVDATPAVGEAQVGSAWKSVLVGGTGAGGQGIYALDVTDPASFDASKVMWEFTDRDDADLGNVIGQPQIRKFRVSALSSAATPVALQEKWFAVVAGGVNNYVADGYASTSGQPAIFLLDLSKPTGTAWTEGTNYYKIVFPIDAAISATRATGIANFAITESATGTVNYLYAGDLHGRMWKLDFSKISGAASTSNWTVDRLSVFTKSSAAQPLFLARDAAGTPQPITASPNLPVGPNGSTLVVFGTGKYLETSDNVVNASTQRQSIYAIYDKNDTQNDSASPGASAIDGRGRLQAGSVGSSNVIVPAFTWGRPATNGDTTQRSGWYVDFPYDGERYINSGVMAGSYFTFGSAIPPSSATQACGTGTGYVYSVNVFDGSGTSTASDVGLLGAPLVFEVGDGAKTASDSTGRITKTVTNQIILSGSGGSGLSVSSNFSTTANLGRLSWRQINRYQEIRNAP